MRNEVDDDLEECGIEELYGVGEHTLRCKYCKILVPTDADPNIWASYHIRVAHRDKIHELALKRASWVEALESQATNE